MKKKDTSDVMYNIEKIYLRRTYQKKVTKMR